MTLSDLLGTITSTLTTRLLIEAHAQNETLAGPSFAIVFDPKLLASVVDELARNTMQVMMYEQEMFAEALVLLRDLVDLDDGKAFASTAKQQMMRRARDLLACAPPISVTNEG